mmetsp:Transcript_79421/g.161556  ORF Transcript_79421/g.161556 Transcript_79421/m.161556 type:complete len:243 (-) Transcript_79421:112-840(-)
MPKIFGKLFKNSVRLMAPASPGSMHWAQKSDTGPRHFPSASSLNFTKASAVSGSRARKRTRPLPAAFSSRNIARWSCFQPTARQALPKSEGLKAPLPFTSMATRHARPAPPGPPYFCSRKLRSSRMLRFFGDLMISGNGAIDTSHFEGATAGATGRGFLRRLCAQWSKKVNSSKVTVPAPCKSKASKRHLLDTAKPRERMIACSSAHCMNSWKFIRVAQAFGTSSHACLAPPLYTLKRPAAS